MVSYIYENLPQKNLTFKLYLYYPIKLGSRHFTMYKIIVCYCYYFKQ